MTTKEYYERNKERLRREGREKYWRDVESSRAKGREKERRQRAANPEKQRAVERAYYSKNRQRIRENAQRWLEERPGYGAQMKARERRERPQNHLFHRAKERAKELGLPFDIVKSDIEVPAICPALGIPLLVRNDGKTGAWDNSPSLDRVVPALGYVKGNIRVISWRANTIKRDASFSELLMIAEYIKKELGVQCR